MGLGGRSAEGALGCFLEERRLVRSQGGGLEAREATIL